MQLATSTFIRFQHDEPATLPRRDIFRLSADAGSDNPSGMNTPKLLLIAFGSLVCGMLPAFAGEFPDSWTWDDKPEFRADHAALEGKPMPAFHVSDWINGGITGADIKGKVVVVDLYATWCGPCMRAIPHNNELLKTYKDKGLVVIGVCTSSDGQEVFADNAKEHDIQYPAARDPELKTEKAWAVHYYPTYAIIDRKGIVRAIGLQPQYVETVVQKLLAEPAP
jgi:cytochrome c biogenesis protein CcmG/thiol:disulfide interchange protein DsbE